MKLHLPKQLFTALLAAFTLATPATLTLGSTAWGGWSGDSFTLESATTDSISTEGQTPGNLGFFIRTGEDADMAVATVTLLQLQAGDNLYIDGSWQQEPVEFTGLTIETLEVKDAGSATLNVYANNTANINALTGSLSNVTNAGNLVLGDSSSETPSTFTFGNLTSSGSLTVAGNAVASSTLVASDKEPTVTADGGRITVTGSLETNILSLKNGGSVEIDGGTVSADRLGIHESGSSHTETFTLKNGLVTVSGEDLPNSGSTQKYAAITIGHWRNGAGKLLVEGGTLNALNGSISMGYNSAGTLGISGGVVNTKGIFYEDADNKAGTITQTSGRLNLGTGGIENRGDAAANRSASFTGGTLGVLDAAGWTLQKVHTTIGTITIDTNVWDAATGATAIGDAAGNANISLLGNLQAAEGGMNITLAGNGSITIDHTLHGTVTLVENAGARLYYDAGNMNNYDKVLSGLGSTGASGFLQGYQIVGAGSNVAVYAVESDTAATLTNGAVMLETVGTELYVRDELAYDGTTMGNATHYYVEEGGVFDFTGYDLGDEPTATNDVALIGLMNKMSGAGTVKLASSAIIQTKDTRTDVTLATNYKVAGNASASLTLTSWKGTNWRTWQVGAGGSITVGDNGDGTLNILAGQRLSIQNGGQVSVGTLNLGYGGTSSNTDNPGSLVMSGSGSKLTVGGIVMQNGIGENSTWLNEVNITGGTLKVTGATAITYNADNVKTAVTLGGSDAASSVLLQTGTTTGWVMSKQSNAASTFNVGYVTIDGANTQSITFNGATLTGAITNNASLILGEDVVWNEGATVSNAGTLQINKGTGDLVLNDQLDKNYGAYKPSAVTNSAAGNLVLANTGNKTLSGDITISNGGKVTLKGGTFGTADAAITYSIQAENTTTLVLDGVEAYLQKTGNTDQILGINTELTNGSVMHLLGNDRLNWGGSFSLTMGLNSLLDVGSTRQSLSGNTLKLAGGTIYGSGGEYNGVDASFTAGLDYHLSGIITVTENSLIATAVAARTGSTVLTMDVAANKTLTIGSYAVGEATYTGSFVGNGSFTKTGNGTVLYKGAAFTNTLDVKAGVFEYYVEDERTHTGSITDSGTTSGDTTTYNGIFKKSGSGTLTLDSANTSVTTLNVAGGKLVYNSSTDTTHTISGASGSTFEKTGSGILTANTNDYSGEILVSAGTLKNNAENQTNQKVTVATGATVDVNGNAAYYNLTLQEGATLTNTHTVAAPDSTGTGKKQLHTITLEGDAKVTGTSQFGMVGSGHATSNLHLNDHTLTKEGSNTFHLFNTTVQSQGLIQVNGGTVKAHGNNSGTLNLTKASLAIDGGTFELGHCNQSIQNLTLTSGTLTIGNGLTLTALGDTTMSGGTVSGNLCLSGTITLNGSVNMSGATLSGTSLVGFTLLASAKPANSGLNSFTYQLWSGDGSVNSAQSTISVGGVNYEMNAATGTFTTADTVYYVATGNTITVGGDSAAEGTTSATSFVVDGTLSVAADTSTESVIGTAGTVNVAESTTLTLTGMGSSIGTLSATNGTVALASGSSLYLGQTGTDAQETTSSIGTVNVAGASTIHLNEKATLSAISKTGNGSITLNGSGTYTLASGASTLGTGVVLGAANNGWTGTVRISSATDNGRINLNALGNASSTVALAGVYKWVDKNINVNLLLEAHDVAGEPNGFKISGTSGGGSTYNFNGNISGDGDLIIANGNTDTGHRTFNFNGDLSDWEGNLIIGVSPAANNARDATVNLTGPNSGSLVFFSSNDADCGLRVDENHHGTLTVNIGNANNSNTAVMNGTISNLVNGTAQGQLALEVVGSTDFNKDVVVTSAVVNAVKTATITGESNSITAGNVKISQKNASLSNVTVQSGSIAATSTADGATGSISGALVEMQSATSFSISDMVLSNVKLSAVKGASVALNNVSGTAELAGAGNYTLGMVGAMENDNGGTALTLKYTSDLAITMSGTGSRLLLSADPTVDANGIFGTYNLTLTLNYTLAGDLPSAETVNWQELVGFTGILGDLLTAQTPEATVDLAEGEAAVAAAGTTPTVEYNYTAPQGDAQVGTLVVTINGLNVPEPATSTLSLLALAALAARRRRK